MEDITHRADPEGPPQRLRQLPSWLMNQTRVIANRRVAERLGRSGVRTDYAVLAAIKEFGPSSQAEIGRQLGIDRSDMVALVNRLQHEGSVVRAADERDRRRNAISITPPGEQRLQHLDRDVALAQNDLLEPLDPEDRRTLITLLQRVVDHHHTLGRGEPEAGRRLAPPAAEAPPAPPTPS